MKKLVLIPAYKPDAKMTDLILALRREGLQVVVVDDGSGTAYADLFASVKPFATVVSCPQNRGKGTALKKGLAYIQEHFTPPYCVTTADADGQHRVKDILRVANDAAAHPGALIVGCRSLGRDMPMKNWWGNMYTKFAFFFSTGKYVHDSQTGLRGFGDAAIPFMLGVSGTRYEYEINVLMLWARCNLPVRELTIRTIYLDGNSSSHFQAFRDSIRIYREIVKLSAPSFGCFLLDILLFAIFFSCLPFQSVWVFVNVLARVIAAALNFAALQNTAKRNFSNIEISPIKYIVFEAAILALNTLLLWVLTRAGMPPIGAKALANVLMFFVGFVPQRKIIYKMRNFGREDRI